MRPNDALLYASQVFQQAMYPPLLNQIRGLMGGSLIQLPATVGELRAPGSAADIERYVRWPKAGARAGRGHRALRALAQSGRTGRCQRGRGI